MRFLNRVLVLSVLLLPEWAVANPLCGDEIAFFNAHATWVTRLFGSTPKHEISVLNALPEQKYPFFKFVSFSQGAVGSVANGFREANTGTIFMPHDGHFAVLHAASGFEQSYNLPAGTAPLDSWEYVLQNYMGDHLYGVMLPQYCQALETNGGVWSGTDYQRVLFLLAGFKHGGPTRYVRVNFGGISKHVHLSMTYAQEGSLTPHIAFTATSQEEAETIIRTVGGWLMKPELVNVTGTAADPQYLAGVTELNTNFGWQAHVGLLDMDEKGAVELTLGMPEEEGNFYVSMALDGQGVIPPKTTLPESLKLMLEAIAHPKKGGLDVSPGVGPVTAN